MKQGIARKHRYKAKVECKGGKPKLKVSMNNPTGYANVKDGIADDR
ncbi:hypothetical protein KUL42_12400 [Alteromonas sp. KUL42]|nr:hypothetical protein KUL42_12400 [Alteromonas sp. KUL42]